MKNPFKRLRAAKDEPAQEITPIAVKKTPAEAPQPSPVEPSAEEPPQPQDSFILWIRSRERGGIQKRERNDIYEYYNEYGTDDGQLICRRYHRYPEHEKDFDLSFSRVLTFDEFNARLLDELDSGAVPLNEYHSCLKNAEALTDRHQADKSGDEPLSQSDQEAIKTFCESLENLKEKEYRCGEGALRCSCKSVIADVELNLWFRRPLCYDAADGEIAGVEKTPIEAYDIDDIWILGVCNRLREQGARFTITELKSAWSLKGEVILLLRVSDFPGVTEELLFAIEKAENFYRFGFYSLGFSR